MTQEIKKVLEKLQAVKCALEQFPDRETAMDYLCHETGLPREECASAYEILMKIPD